MSLKLGLVADIHCNVRGLTAALAALDDCEEILCAGDLMLQYRWEPEILGLLKRRGAHVIQGNHDLSLCESASAGWMPSPDGLEDLAQMPLCLKLKLGGCRVAVHHGSPWDRPQDGIFASIFPSQRAELERAAAGADVVLLGHTHVPMAIQVGGATIVNPGSCGDPSRDAHRVHTCASIDIDSRQVSFHTLMSS